MNSGALENGENEVGVKSTNFQYNNNCIQVITNREIMFVSTTFVKILELVIKLRTINNLNTMKKKIIHQ